VTDAPAARPPIALHVSPHPDDEAIAAPATLLALRDAGHRVVNVLASLGRPADRDRRRGEAEEAARRLGIELVVIDPPLALGRDDDLAAARRRLASELGGLLERENVAVVLGPSPHDGHHGHETVGRAIADALEAVGEGGPRWWMWGLWAELPHPTLYVPFGEARLAEVLKGLSAHAGELARNDYAALVRGRAAANAVLGAERVFGFGSPAAGGGEPFAELLCEVARRDGRWRAGAPRALDSAEPLAPMGDGVDLDWWLRAPSFRERLREQAG
jgi:LmbE family N-acetylglucosaminyl deacetylase